MNSFTPRRQTAKAAKNLRPASFAALALCVLARNAFCSSWNMRDFLGCRDRAPAAAAIASCHINRHKQHSLGYKLRPLGAGCQVIYCTIVQLTRIEAPRVLRSLREIAGSKNPSPGGAWPPPSPRGRGQRMPFLLPWGEGGRGTRSDEGSFHGISRAEGPKGQTPKNRGPMRQPAIFSHVPVPVP